MRYPAQIELAASRRLQAMIAAIHGVAAIAFAGSGHTPLLIAMAVLALGLSAAICVRAERARAGSIIVLEDSGSLTLRDGSRVACAVPLPGSVDFGWAIWLQWREAAGSATGRPCRGAMMLLPDHMGEVAWRRLRIWLRHKSSASLSAAGPD